jgi:ATP-dependent Clp protease ATP-binding subunit ClpB
MLMDEVEKAHPDVFNVLLQVLDDGRLTDGQGRTVDFRNTVIVMTSNLGSDLIQEKAGEENYDGDEGRGHGDRRQALPARVHQPRRRDRRLPPAGCRQIRGIADIQLAYLRSAPGRARPGAHVSDAALIDHLGEAGFDPVYGARPLKRAIQQQLENPLAQPWRGSTWSNSLPGRGVVSGGTAPSPGCTRRISGELGDTTS